MRWGMNKHSFWEDYKNAGLWRLLYESHISVLLNAVRGADLHSYWSKVVSACESGTCFSDFKKTTTKMSFFRIFWQDMLQVA